MSSGLNMKSERLFNFHFSIGISNVLTSCPSSNVCIVAVQTSIDPCLLMFSHFMIYHFRFPFSISFIPLFFSAFVF